MCRVVPFAWAADAFQPLRQAHMLPDTQRLAAQASLPIPLIQCMSALGILPHRHPSIPRAFAARMAATVPRVCCGEPKSLTCVGAMGVDVSALDRAVHNGHSDVAGSADARAPNLAPGQLSAYGPGTAHHFAAAGTVPVANSIRRSSLPPRRPRAGSVGASPSSYGVGGGAGPSDMGGPHVGGCTTSPKLLAARSASGVLTHSPGAASGFVLSGGLHSGGYGGGVSTPSTSGVGSSGGGGRDVTSTGAVVGISRVPSNSTFDPWVHAPLGTRPRRSSRPQLTRNTSATSFRSTESGGSVGVGIMGVTGGWLPSSPQMRPSSQVVDAHRFGMVRMTSNTAVL